MSKQYLYKVTILTKTLHDTLSSVAYYTGEEMKDKNFQIISTPTSERLIWNNINIPNKEHFYDKFSNLPEYLKFRNNKKETISNARNILWRDVDERETRNDSQFARVFELTLPYFLSKDECINLLTDFSETLIHEGMIVDSSLHSATKNQLDEHSIINILQDKDEQKNIKHDYNAYLLCTLRDYDNGQFVNKNREWNNRDKLKEWRTSWLKKLLIHINNNNIATAEEKESWNNKLKLYVDNFDSLLDKNKSKKL